ncbi:NUDIX domain-containing protein [Piscinibacter sp.]|uniref:NUDIX domain-containing protein n=1 Tax=Piscinibacter sp. TaxID=1903157 RepID=UPI0039E4AAE9
MLHRISAGAIVENEGRVLLVRHRRIGKYDFWVAPGGGVKDDESLEAAAAREAKEESGLDIHVSKLIYIEELVNPECRHVKFWFTASLLGGSLDVSHPETVAEFIVEAAWLTPEEIKDKTVFPPVLSGRYWQDRVAGFPTPVSLPLRQMQFW